MLAAARCRGGWWKSSRRPIPSSRTVVVRVHLEETRDIVPGMFGRLLIPMEPEAGSWQSPLRR